MGFVLLLSFLSLFCCFAFYYCLFWFNVVLFDLLLFSILFHFHFAVSRDFLLGFLE